MVTPSLRTTSPPGQAPLIPATMNRFHQWRSDGVDFELWATDEAGFILANPQGAFEVAGHVEICGDRMSVTWQGAITDRPQPWLNAQRALADAKRAERRCA